jgi:hypothetical protein
MNTLSDILSHKQAAEYLGKICLTTLDRLKLPRIKIRRRVLYRKITLDTWLSAQEKSKGVSNE